MVKVKDILREIEHYAPLPLQEGFDNAGVQVGDVNQHATGVLLCLDVTEEVLDEAIEMGCNLIISHHPLAFKSFKSLTGSNYIERCMMKACKYDLVVYAAHTNLDNAVGGVNCKRLWQKSFVFCKKGAAAVPRQLLWMGLLGILTQ